MIAIADDPNLAILEMAVQALGELTDSLMFVGGCALAGRFRELSVRPPWRMIRARPPIDRRWMRRIAAVSSAYSADIGLVVAANKLHDLRI